MSTYILTSMFHHGFSKQISKCFQEIIVKRDKFAFVASEFEKNYYKNDKYFHIF